MAQLQWQTNRKLYAASSNGTITNAHSDSIEFICAIQKTLMYACMYVMPLNDLEGHFLLFETFLTPIPCET